MGKINAFNGKTGFLARLSDRKNTQCVYGRLRLTGKGTLSSRADQPSTMKAASAAEEGMLYLKAHLSG
jgi:hypothetical protein